MTDRPSVVFAYTVKGWGLPIAGNPRNHSALLTGEQIDALRAVVGLTARPEWDRFDPSTPAGHRAAASAARHLAPRAAPSGARRHGPARDGRTRRQAGLDPGGLRPGPGRPVAQRRGRAVPRHDRAGRRHLDQPGRLHQPDRACSRPTQRRSWSDDPLLQVGRGPDRAAHRAGHLRDEPVPAARPARPRRRPVRPAAAAGRHGLRPVRAAAGSTRFIYARLLRLAVRRRRHAVRASRSPPRAARTSRRSPRRSGWSCPGSRCIEPAYADRAGLAAVRRARPDRRPARPTPSTAAPAEDGAYYFRLTHPAARPGAVRGGAGAGSATRCCAARCSPAPTGWSTPARRRDAADAPHVQPGRVRRGAARGAGRRGRAGRRGHRRARRRRDLAWTGCTPPGSAPCGRASGRRPRRRCRARCGRPSPDRAPVVTVHDAASHAMAWLGSALGVPAVPLGVDQFGQSGTIADLYDAARPDCRARSSTPPWPPSRCADTRAPALRSRPRSGPVGRGDVRHAAGPPRSPSLSVPSGRVSPCPLTTSTSCSGRHQAARKWPARASRHCSRTSPAATGVAPGETARQP